MASSDYYFADTPTFSSTFLPQLSWKVKDSRGEGDRRVHRSIRYDHTFIPSLIDGINKFRINPTESILRLVCSKQFILTRPIIFYTTSSENHFDSTFPRDDPVKWKNGKMANIRTRVAHARIQMRWKFGRTGRPRGSRRKAASVLELSEKEERKRRGSSFFSPSLHCFCFSSRGVSPSFLRSIKIYSRTEAEILRGLPATFESTHIFRHRDVSFSSFAREINPKLVTRFPET